MWKVNGRLQFRKKPTHQSPKMLQSERSCFFTGNSQSFYLSITDIIEAMNNLIEERHNHSKNCITSKVSRRTQKVEIFLQMEDLVLHSLVRTWDTFSAVMLAKNLELL